MIIKAMALGSFQSNCYLLGCEETHEALVVDPGDEPEQIIAELARLELSPVAYFHTHGHIDHVGATARVKAKLGGEILIHEADHFLYEGAPQQALTFGIQIPPMAPVDRFIAGGDTITWGRVHGSVRETPGHSPGGVCLVIGADQWRKPAQEAGTGPALVLTGDTLFAGSIGRTDLPGGDHEQLLASVRDQLLVMPDPTVVASGHGPLTTIGDERRHNPFLQGL
jgi:hydroxyacylglutathione hydrolase